MRKSTNRPNTPTTFIKKRPPRSVDIFDLRTKKRIRTVAVPNDIHDAGVSFSRSNGRSSEIVWVCVQGNRCFTFLAKTGRLRGVSPDPTKDPHVQRALDAFLTKGNSPIRFALVRAMSRSCTLFYDFAEGTWESNRISATSMFKERGVAEAAAKALSKARKSHFFRDSVRMQVVEFRKTANGGKILSSVNSPWGKMYRPMLRRDQPIKPSTNS